MQQAPTHGAVYTIATAHPGYGGGATATAFHRQVPAKVLGAGAAHWAVVLHATQRLHVRRRHTGACEACRISMQLPEGCHQRRARGSHHRGLSLALHQHGSPVDAPGVGGAGCCHKAGVQLGAEWVGVPEGRRGDHEGALADGHWGAGVAGVVGWAEGVRAAGAGEALEVVGGRYLSPEAAAEVDKQGGGPDGVGTIGAGELQLNCLSDMEGDGNVGVLQAVVGEGERVGGEGGSGGGSHDTELEVDGVQEDLLGKGEGVLEDEIEGERLLRGCLQGGGVGEEEEGEVPGGGEGGRGLAGGYGDDGGVEQGLQRRGAGGLVGGASRSSWGAQDGCGGRVVGVEGRAVSHSWVGQEVALEGGVGEGEQGRGWRGAGPVDLLDEDGTCDMNGRGAEGALACKTGPQHASAPWMGETSPPLGPRRQPAINRLWQAADYMYPCMLACVCAST
jgi:hypothetical protein